VGGEVILSVYAQQIFSQSISKISRKLLNIWAGVGVAPGWHYQACEAFGQHLANPDQFLAVLPNQCHISCNLQDHVQRHIYFFGVYEPIESHLFTSLLKPGMTVIDAGANIGQYTLLAATQVGDRGAVHSFEPVPKTFEKLSHHVAVNQLSNVSINQAALWYQETVLKLGLADDMVNNVGSYSTGVVDINTAVEAKALRLDDYAINHRIERVDFIKMDIEGAELCALQGMQNILRRDRPLILLEINRLALGRLGYTPEDIWSFLTVDLGYIGYGVELSACRKITQTTDIQQKNLLFAPAESIDLIEQNWNLKQILRWARKGKSSALG
jgi:FkbM family methyltransferase